MSNMRSQAHAGPQQKARTALDAALQLTRPAFITAIVFSFFINLLGLTGPLYMMQVYDRVLSSRNITTLVVLTLIIAFLYLIWAALESLRSRVLVRAGVKFDEVASPPMFVAVQRMSLLNPSAGSAQALRDTDTVREFYTGQGLISLCDLPWVPIYIIVATMLHPYFGLLAVVSCIFSGLLAVANDRATRASLNEATKANIHAGNQALTTFRNSEVLQAMGMVGQLRDRWRKNHMGALGWQAAASDKAGVLMAATKFNRSFVQSLVLGLGAYLAITGQISPGVMIAASIIVGRCIQPVEMAIGNWKSMVNMRSAYDRVQTLLRALPPTGKRVRLPDPTGALSVENLVVRAPGREAPVLRGVSFQMAPGMVLGVIGPSAAGKSSLARALVGVWPVLNGAVRLDGSDLSHWDPDQLGEHLGYLPQDVELFSGSIAENIARFREGDDEKIITAAQMAGVHEMIQNLPDGYNTQIGDGGQALSGGQRQRIGLARAIYGMPSLIVLDEPNASLDATGEQALMDAVRRLKEAGKTVIIITHKTNSLALCDLVLLMKDGTVQAFGPRDEVLRRLMGPRVVHSAEGQEQAEPARKAAAAQGGMQAVAQAVGQNGAQRPSQNAPAQAAVQAAGGAQAAAQAGTAQAGAVQAGARASGNNVSSTAGHASFQSPFRAFTAAASTPATAQAMNSASPEKAGPVKAAAPADEAAAISSEK
ncbi:type I secretion system permease/ATPase [Xanthobacter sp. TB0139]|uniref:type I secretion system permease/ATPase n=1 Tax=Xanthobacter sp. TB0139 TaxID=3459178 RepID=UPI004039D1C8